MKLFMTGSESFVGKELIIQCKKNNIEVIGVDLKKKDNPETIEIDICDKRVVEYIPEGIDAIIHLAALSRDPDCKNNAYNCFNSNVMGTLNLIEAAKKKNVKQFIFASSEWVYDSFENGKQKNEDDTIDISKITSEYALSKLVSEANLRQQYKNGFCPVTILRFGIIYGSRKDNWSAVEAVFNIVSTKDEIIVGSLKTGRHFIHVSDIASAIIASIGLNFFNILNVQYDKLITLGDIINVGKKLLNKDVKVSESNPDSPSIRPVSNDKIKNAINWSPSISLEEGLKSLADYLGLL